MSNLIPLQATVISMTKADPNATVIQLALFKADGTAYPIPTKAPAQIDSVATDVAGLKTDLNALLAKLRTAGILS